jgi:AcrR family transcriptional regulator
MPAPSKKSYHHGDLRDALIESVAKLARDSNSIQLTVKDLTRDVGVTPAAFYRHFGSVEELFSEVRIEGLELFEAAEREALKVSSANSVERVEGLIRAYVRFAATYPGHFRVMTDSEVARMPNAEMKDRPALALVAQAIADGQRLNQISAGNPKDLAIAAWAAVHGLSSLFANGPLRAVLDHRPSRAKQLEDVLVNLICRGLTAAPTMKVMRSSARNMARTVPSPGSKTR